MRITTVGDVVLDVIVDVPDGLHPDDDAEASILLAAGGQAANVAAWAASLGAEASVIGPQGTTDTADLITNRLAGKGVRHLGIPVERDGVVVSLVTQGQRTLASDAGDQTWLDAIPTDLLPADLDWLHLSSYPLLRSPEPLAVAPLVDRARALGARLSVDLSSAALLRAFGAQRYRACLVALSPDVVFANESEWNTLQWTDPPDGTSIVVKRGGQGATLLASGRATRLRAETVDVVDATGAGDALAAGFLVGGPELAMQTAARCVQTSGAQP
jgi:sugar/nucleoside kinase (ribokinase family)